jgi:muconate cycloisomerase
VGSDPVADEAFLAGFAAIALPSRIRIKFTRLLHTWSAGGGAAVDGALHGHRRVMLVESVALRGDLEGLREYRRRGRLPVSEHVHGARHAWELLHRGCVDILNVSPYVLGGLRATIRTAAMAEAAGASVLIGTTQELNLGTAAVAHLGAVTARPAVPRDNAGPRLYVEDVVTGAVDYVAGDLMVPTGPGLGPTVIPERLEELRSDGSSTFGSDLVGALDRTVRP